MRDLPFLFLLTPLLARSVRILFPLLIAAAFLPPLSPYFARIPGWVLSPYSILFFTMGCYLRSIPKGIQEKLLRFYSGRFVLMFLIASILCFIWRDELLAVKIIKRHAFMPVAGAIVQMVVLYWIARWMEVHIPKVKSLGIKLAPVAFMAYVAHYPIAAALGPLLKKPIVEDVYLFILPFPIMGLLYLAFIFMKRWCRPLLRPLAYYKLRPEDIKHPLPEPSQAAPAQEGK